MLKCGSEVKVPSDGRRPLTQLCDIYESLQLPVALLRRGAAAQLKLLSPLIYLKSRDKQNKQPEVRFRENWINRILTAKCRCCLFFFSIYENSCVK